MGSGKIQEIVESIGMSVSEINGNEKIKNARGGAKAFIQDARVGYSARKFLFCRPQEVLQRSQNGKYSYQRHQK